MMSSTNAALTSILPLILLVALSVFTVIIFIQGSNGKPIGKHTIQIIGAIGILLGVILLIVGFKSLGILLSSMIFIVAYILFVKSLKTFKLAKVSSIMVGIGSLIGFITLFIG